MNIVRIMGEREREMKKNIGKQRENREREE